MYSRASKRLLFFGEVCEVLVKYIDQGDPNF